MRRHITVLFALLIVGSAVAPTAAGQSNADTESTVDVSCEFPLELTDATGTTITLEERPESIVTLQASDTQTVYEIGAEDRLVGMPYGYATSDFDRGDRVNIGDGWTIKHEQVINLDPDIVLAANATKEGDIEQLRNAGLTVYQFSDAKSLDDVRENVRTAGKLTGECDGAEETITWMNEQLEIVERTLDGADRPTVYYAMGDDGYTAGSGTFINEALTTAGMTNIAAEAGVQSYKQINPETVVNESPAWIVYPNDREQIPIHESVTATPAYQNDNILPVNANYISQPAPRVVYAITDIVKTVHPEAYEAASAELDAAPEDGTGSNDQQNDSIPGFGVPAALVALLAAIGFVARRR